VQPSPLTREFGQLNPQWRPRHRDHQDVVVTPLVGSTPQGPLFAVQLLVPTYAASMSAFELVPPLPPNGPVIVPASMLPRLIRTVVLGFAQDVASPLLGPTSCIFTRRRMIETIIADFRETADEDPIGARVLASLLCS
jgi:hypothetical protein